MNLTEIEIKFWIPLSLQTHFKKSNRYDILLHLRSGWTKSAEALFRQLKHIQGAFREQLVAKASQCVKADGLSAGEAAMAEPLSVCLHAVRRAGDGAAGY